MDPSSDAAARAIAEKEQGYDYSNQCSGDKLADPYEYVAYIDEAGDPGLTKVRPLHENGASEWLMVSAVVVRRQFEPHIAPWIRNTTSTFKNHQRPGIHFADLNPAKKLVVCQELAKLPIRCFVVASNKKNMQGYQNPFASKVSLDVNWFYCWMTRILLERVTYWAAERSMRDFGKPKTIRIEYSRRGGLSYSQLNAYFELLRVKDGDLKLPLGRIRWPVIDREQVAIFNHETRGGLHLADIVASAFYKGCDRYTSGGCDPRFATILAPRMARDPDRSWGAQCGFGVKLLPSWRVASLLPEQQQVFRHYGYPAASYSDEWWDPDSSVPDGD
ncbi:UNVERIFIED_ORG: hypothetical protein J2W74_001909 [Methylorubrum zatmanii]